MAVPFSQVLKSRLFRFSVGGEVDGVATDFYLHEDAIAHLSEPLRVLTKGGLGGLFSETQNAAAVWPNVTKGTFECFAEFAYSCDYSIPQPVARAVVESVPPPPTSTNTVPPSSSDDSFTIPEAAPDSWDSLSFSGKKKKDKSTFRSKERWEAAQKPFFSGPTLAERFQALSYPLLAPRSHSGSYDLSLPFSKNSSYANILLCHATLYILADFWMIDSLKALTLFKLHATLCAFQLNDQNAEDIVSLARYAYEEGVGSDQGIGGLRNLVCQYMASKAVELTIDEGFLELLQEGGPFVRDLWRFEVQRL